MARKSTKYTPNDKYYKACMNNYIGFGVVNDVKESNEVPNTNINMDSNKCKFLLDEFYKCNT